MYAHFSRSLAGKGREREGSYRSRREGYTFQPHTVWKGFEHVQIQQGGSQWTENGLVIREIAEESQSLGSQKGIKEI